MEFTKVKFFQWLCGKKSLSERLEPITIYVNLSSYFVNI